MCQAWEYGEMSRLSSGIKPVRLQINDGFAVQVRFREHRFFREAVVEFDAELVLDRMGELIRELRALKRLNLMVSTIDTPNELPMKSLKKYKNIVDLASPNPDKKRRQNIRKALGAKVYVEIAKEAEVPELNALAKDFAKKKDLERMLITEGLIDYSIRSPESRIFAVKHEGKMLGFEIIFLDAKSKMTYAGWASWNEKAYELNAPSLLTWEIIEWSRKNGYAKHDLGGIVRDEEMGNIARFKESFGGINVPYYSYREVAFLNCGIRV